LKLRDLGFVVGAVSAGMLVYGALYESKRLVLEKRELWLPRWPERLDGFKVALLGDFHLRDLYSLELATRSVEMALDAEPDMVALIGDLVGHWRDDSAFLLGDCLDPLRMMGGNVVAVPGNHEYWGGTPDLLAPILDHLNIKLLRNEVWRHQGISWAGIDSLNAHKADPLGTLAKADEDPVVVLWHEPDELGRLPGGCALMLSGHTHGGQFVFPGGLIPMKSRNGRRYVGGFYPDAPTPLYVTRGVGTTGPPTRFNCPPEVSILTLRAAGS
jgi:predicted MPP superfamily phosphohydrolase